MAALRYGILVAGIAFYAFSITTLLTSIKQENFIKSFYRIIDKNQDGVISKREMNAFNPCPEYKPRRLNRIFSHYGRLADINDLVDQIDQRGVINIVKPCIGDVASFTNPDHIKNLKQSEVQKQMLETYDINGDDVINWGQFNIANSSLKKELPYARTIFKFFDKNHDWKITRRELARGKVKQLAQYIGAGGKRRR